jgi:acyl-CoA synthetase (AMP-forming)/AMP-acid ligase II
VSGCGTPRNTGTVVARPPLALSPIIPAPPSLPASRFKHYSDNGPHAVYQIQASRANSLLVCVASLPIALAAAEKTGIPRTRIAVFDVPNLPRDANRVPFPTVGELIHMGLTSAPAFKERRLSAGEAARTLAFLCFSSGTTGRPKVWRCSGSKGQ